MYNDNEKLHEIICDVDVWELYRCRDDKLMKNQGYLYDGGKVARSCH